MSMIPTALLRAAARKVACRQQRAPARRHEVLCSTITHFLQRRQRSAAGRPARSRVRAIDHEGRARRRSGARAPAAGEASR